MTHIRHALHILMCALREIFDESAYARFLERTRLVSSPDAYAAFCKDRESTKSRQTKCC
jgi:hypothetical protein